MESSFDAFLTKQLNEQQRRAVTPASGIFLVRAGAGSGKTRVITARLTNLLLTHHVPAASIVALTFTNKAAREMKERVERFLPSGCFMPVVGTFHSYCLRLLKLHGSHIALSNFSILDEDDQEKLVRTILKKFTLTKKISPKSVLSSISRFKNSVKSLSELQPMALSDPLIRQLFVLYEQQKKDAHCLDFDDLLLETLRLFQTQPTFKKVYQQTVRHVLVDEYQDTNCVQHALLHEMITDVHGIVSTDSLCVVGDEDQSIYSWRGATISNIINFTKDFPQATTITIDQNYRSVQPILDTANAIIAHNTQRAPKELWSERSAKNRVHLISCASTFQEGMFIGKLGRYLQEHGQLDSLAILYRANHQSRTIEETLIRHAIPYKIIGGVQFYDRQEIKDIFAYLKLATNPYDRIAFMRAIGTPPRGLGEKFVDLFLEKWEQQPLLDFAGVASLLADNEQIGTTKHTALHTFVQLIQTIAQQTTVVEATHTLLQATEFLTYLREAYDAEEARMRTDNVKELLNAMHSLAAQGITTTALFLQEVALMQEHLTPTRDDHQYIRLMTLHSAKGLEFNNVIICGLEEGMLPSGYTLYEPQLLEEERRLLYVGITRARERLFLTQSQYRHVFGQMQEQVASRFVTELPKDSVTCHDCTRWSDMQWSPAVTQWMQGTLQSIKPSLPAAIVPPQLPVQKIVRQKTTMVIPAQSATPTQPTMSAQQWKKHQPVTHETFGTGIITHVDTENGQVIRLTISFKLGIKKINPTFVRPA